MRELENKYELKSVRMLKYRW